MHAVTEEPEEEAEPDVDYNQFVTKGSTVFIPCIPALGTNRVSVWSINGAIYPLASLRHQTEYNVYDYGGLTVYDITFETPIIYQCVENGCPLYTIRVSSSDGISDNVCKKQLKIVSNEVDLANLFFSFRFNTFKSTQSSDCCHPDNVTFTMNITDGVQSLWSNNTNVYLPKFSPPREFFQGNAYAEVYATNNGQECARLDHKIKVDIDGKNFFIIITLYYNYIYI